MAKIMIDCENPNDYNELSQILESITGNCAITYSKRDIELQEKGFSTSTRESSKIIAEETDETPEAVRNKIRRAREGLGLVNPQKSNNAANSVSYQPHPNSVTHPPTDRGGNRPNAGRPRIITFNHTNDNIEWAKWTWNPVTGCKHGCEYCYARDIANRFYPEKFEPTFRPERLKAPKNTKIPAHRQNEEGIRNVFVCSMADLFGDWVPDEWINSILKEVRDNPQWNFIFLTKNPKKYLEFSFPENSCIGATADTADRMDTALEVFERMGGLIRFVSCEPLSELVSINPKKYDNTAIDWLIIGGQSKTSRSPASQPEWSWVEKLICEARSVEIPVYWKPNLEVRPKQYPIFGI